MYKNYEFFPVMKAAAAEKFGEGNYLLLHNRTVCGVASSQMFPPSHEEDGPFDFGPDFWAEEADPTLIEEWWEKNGDTYKAKNGDRTWQAVANPGWPLSVEHDGETFPLSKVEAKSGLAFYRPERGYPVLHARLTDDGLDVWDPAVLAAELAARPFPAVLGRNCLLDKTFPEALAEHGVTAKVTELGRHRGTLYRVEYVADGEPRVAYEHIQVGVDDFCSGSVVLAEPVIPDERDLDWLYRLILGKPQRIVSDDVDE